MSRSETLRSPPLQPARFSGSTPSRMPVDCDLKECGRIGEQEIFPAQIPSAQVARHGDIRCRICPEIEDEFPANPAIFSPSRCLENERALRCGALSAFAVRQAFAISNIDICALGRRPRLTGSEEKSGQAPRRPKMENGLRGARPQSVASRRYGGPPIRTSGGIPAEAGKRHQIALRFLPEAADASMHWAKVARCSDITFSSFTCRPRDQSVRASKRISSASCSSPSTPSLVVSSVTESHPPVRVCLRMAL